MKTTLATLAILMLITLAASGCKSTSKQPKPPIVLTAFGTSIHEARKVFDYIDKKVKAHYPDHQVHWAFTSSIIRKKLKKQGLVTYSLEEVISDLKKEGVNKVVIQSLHVVPGQEFKEISQVDTTGLTVAVGNALLTSDQDIEHVISAIQGQFVPNCPNVVVGHGNDHHPEFNKQLLAFKKALTERFDHATLCSIEGIPGTGGLIEVKKKAKIAGKVNFVPLMIVSGDHIMNDVMGNEKDSWKSCVDAKETSFSKSLGYNDQVLEVYYSHIDQAIGKLK